MEISNSCNGLVLYLHNDELFDILDDIEIPPDEYLPKTGVSLETECILSTIHIDTPDYGTLFKTVLLVTTLGKIERHKNSFNKNLIFSS